MLVGGGKSHSAMESTIKQPYPRFRDAVSRLAEQWLAHGLPAQQQLHQHAADLQAMRTQLKVAGLWQQPPSMVTATLDDGLGQGLAIIENFAAAIGIRLVCLGLLRTPEEIVAACCRVVPDFLGLTILQFDTEEHLVNIGQQLPPQTRIIAGGPVYLADREFAARTGTAYAARSVADFLQYMVADANAATPDG